MGEQWSYRCTTGGGPLISRPPRASTVSQVEVLVSDWLYFAIIDPPETDTQHPTGLLRQRPNALRHDAEILSKDGSWWPSDLPARIYLGHFDYGDLVEIPAARARAIIEQWVQTGRITAAPVSDDN